MSMFSGKTIKSINEQTRTEHMSSDKILVADTKKVITAIAMSSLRLLDNAEANAARVSHVRHVRPSIKDARAERLVGVSKLHLWIYDIL